ncbi:MAG: hypothetical protein ABIP85_22705 [Chthoniobacteraceae bacterium]
MNEFTPELKVILASLYLEIAATTDTIMKMASMFGIQYPKSLSELNAQRMETMSILFGREEPPMKQAGTPER